MDHVTATYPGCASRLPGVRVQALSEVIDHGPGVRETATQQAGPETPLTGGDGLAVDHHVELPRAAGLEHNFDAQGVLNRDGETRRPGTEPSGHAVQDLYLHRPSRTFLLPVYHGTI